VSSGEKIIGSDEDEGEGHGERGGEAMGTKGESALVGRGGRPAGR